MVSFLGVLPTAHVYVVSTLPDKVFHDFLPSILWLVTEKAAY